MNLRIYSSPSELWTALAGAISRVSRQSISPHVGLIGADIVHEALLDHLEEIADLRIAAIPGKLADSVSGRRTLRMARETDLMEPLDAVVVLGEPPKTVPAWYEDARMTLIVPQSHENISRWLAADLPPDAWLFVIDTDLERTRSLVAGKESRESE